MPENSVNSDRSNRRAHKRSVHINCSVFVSSGGKDDKENKDGKIGEEVDIIDLSSGGIRFSASNSKEYNLNDKLYFDVTVYNFLVEFNFKASGEIKSKVTDYESGKHKYGVKFTGLDQNTKIRIDENVINDRPIGKEPYDIE